MGRIGSILMAVTGVIALACPVQASEMFSEYPKRFAIGYDSSPLVRYWFTETWGLDIRPNYRISDDATNDSYSTYSSTSDSESGTYFLQVNGVYQMKSFSYADYNLMFGVSYEERYSKYTNTDYTPSGYHYNSSSRLHAWRVLFGPEVEVKVPFYSRLRVSASILANYTRSKDRYASSSSVLSTTRSTRFSIDSDGNSLDGLMHVGLRYYF